MKKKIGPLPLWAWIVIAGSTIGIVLYMRSKSSSASGTASNLPLTTDQAGSIDPATGLTYGEEEQAGVAAQTDASGGSTDDSTTPTDVATGVTTTDQLQTDLGALSTQISQIQANGLSDSQPTSSPAQTFAGEVSDVTAAFQGLQALQADLVPTPQTASSGSGSSSSGSTKTPVSKVATTATRTLVSSTYEVINGVAYNVHKYSTGPAEYVKAPTQPKAKAK